MQLSRYLLILLLVYSPTYLFAQTSEPENAVITLVQVQNIKPTGKRHNSYYFTFKVQKVLKGVYTDSVFHSQEIYHDFGGGQLLTKLGWRNYNKQTTQVLDTFIIKFSIRNNKQKEKPEKSLIWVAEKHRHKNLERLENMLRELFDSKKKNMAAGIMLREYDGRLFFTIENIFKVAVETRSGWWVTATVDGN